MNNKYIYSLERIKYFFIICSNEACDKKISQKLKSGPWLIASNSPPIKLHIYYDEACISSSDMAWIIPK
jgi:hypothetical protein